MIVAIAALWGFSEATWFFVLPDFFLLPAIIARPQYAVRLVAATFVGSLVGLVTLMAVASRFPGGVHDFIVALPLTSQPMFDAVAGTTGNAASVLHQPVSGVPAKVWAWTAVSDGVSPVPFLAVVMAARLIRFAAVALVARLLAAAFGDVLRRRARWLLVGYTLIFAVGLVMVAALR